MRLSRHMVLVVLLLGGCTSLRTLIERGTPAERLAASVTIVRGERGVPHIIGGSAAGVAFGMAYAQAQDDYWQIEEDYLHALGRASHWYGDRYLADDLVRAAFEVERLSREEYEREPPDRRVIWDAFAAGINYYVRTSGVRPRLITNYEPWMVFALFRSPDAGMVVDGVRLGQLPQDTMPAGVYLAGAWIDTASDMIDSSDAWAVSPSRTESGRALLLHRSDGEFFGNGRPYEALLLSEDGWHVRGFAMLGTPVPGSGHNARIAWSRTPPITDHADVYEVTFDHPTDPLMYRFGGDWRRAVEWQDTLLINSPGGVVERVYRFRRTHHGPIVAQRDTKLLAMRIARVEEGGALQQLYAMGRAVDLAQFRTALDQRSLTSGTMYGDADGNISYIAGSAVPVRDPTVDWTRPVDGSVSVTEWRGYHPIDDLPQILNPSSGWIHSAALATPGASARGVALDSTPLTHMTAATGSGRAGAARQRLSADTSWTFAELVAAAFEPYVSDAAQAIAPLVLEWEQIGGHDPERARRLDGAIDLLRSWDHHATIDSEAATLFVLWQERLHAGDYHGEFVRFRALESVITRLEQDWGAAGVAWGEVNRLQRIPADGSRPFSDERHSVPIAGAPGRLGSLFGITARDEVDARRRYAIRGTGWIMAVELGPDVQSRTVVPFGQSADSASAHWFDQAPLLARGELKRAWFTREQIMMNAARVYRPSEAAVRELP